MNPVAALVPGRPGRALLVALLVALWVTGAGPAAARVGFGDPAAPWRERAPDQWLRVDGYLRARAALYGNLDLDRGVSSNTGLALWPAGEGPLDLGGGSDLRLRVRPSFFAGEDVRVVVETDVIDGVAFGQSPRGAPFASADQIVSGTAAQGTGLLAGQTFLWRSAYAEVQLPIGLFAIGRMPSHFGVGIATNAGDDIDDDIFDRADRVAFVAPLFGHYLALAWDVGAAGAGLASPTGAPTGASIRAPTSAPAPRRLGDGQHAASLALLRYRAPWEVALFRDAGETVFDYGLVTSLQWQVQDTPGAYVEGVPPGSSAATARVARGYRGLAVDGWLRLVRGAFRLEGELFAAAFEVDNASPLAGVTFRAPTRGAPFGAVLQAAYEAPRVPWSARLEGGLASSDPSPGFLPPEGRSAVAAAPGDVFGAQVDGGADARMDAFRFHPNHRIDLILWRTLLGGVSEALYGKAMVRYAPVEALTCDLSAVYSHALQGQQTPGGIEPLGAELDATLTFRQGAFSLRADAGVLVPLGGMGARGGQAPGLAHLWLWRAGYAF